METNELKPCPFCGGEAEITKWHEGYFVECREQRCGGTIGAYKTEEEAIDAWNTRKERTCHVRQAYFHDCSDLDNLMEGIAFSPEDTVACICDFCGMNWRFDRGIRPNYCPNCGAKVVGVV